VSLKEKSRLSSGALAKEDYIKCLFLKAMPDPDFRYFSNSKAFSLSANENAKTTGSLDLVDST